MRQAASTRALCGLCLGAAALIGCTASAEDVRPPPDTLFFPSGIAASPDGAAVFVANSNSELRYDSGTIDVIDVARVQAAIAAWTGTARDPGACTQDLDHRETLICEEAPFIRADASVRIGNFATDIAVQSFDASHTRLIIPTRGDPSIAWADYDGNGLSCATTGSFQLCDDAHRLTQTLEDPDQTHVADEPFGVFASASPDGSGFAVVSHQTNGAVTLIDSPRDGAAVISDVKYDVFAPDLLTGLRGSTGVAGHTGPGGPIVYVGARTEDRIQMFTVGRPPLDVPPYLIQGAFFFLDGIGTNPGTGSSSNTRGMAFSGTGDNLYLANRAPPSLQVYDTSSGTDGTPRNVIAGGSDICRNASTLTVFNPSADPAATTAPTTDDGERVYVTCFDDGQVYVVDPSGLTQVEAIITVGRGPYGVAVARQAKLMFISNFLEDTIAVVDVNPSSPNRNRVVLRIGTPKAP